MYVGQHVSNCTCNVYMYGACCNNFNTCVLCNVCRHPEANERPNCTELVQHLSESGGSLLHWQESDKQVHPQASNRWESGYRVLACRKVSLLILSPCLVAL